MQHKINFYAYYGCLNPEFSFFLIGCLTKAKKHCLTNSLILVLETDPTTMIVKLRTPYKQTVLRLKIDKVSHPVRVKCWLNNYPATRLWTVAYKFLLDFGTRLQVLSTFWESKSLFSNDILRVYFACQSPTRKLPNVNFFYILVVCQTKFVVDKPVSANICLTSLGDYRREIICCYTSLK